MTPQVKPNKVVRQERKHAKTCCQSEHMTALSPSFILQRNWQESLSSSRQAAKLNLIFYELLRLPEDNTKT
ncbi:hypothetical protein T4B_9695 [Trichinella pseudospiralis]|uniref:Uncharacterized protein n=1 Tax=Trichinella pseudospiralis TaxID=6337 RepID=A0A0V1JGT6_TRIPS|nr:hypothetical protein T4B_3909 [Trichinella pseudospiralis]KRZ34154.1 hypothetical protein T4B_9695 [Trichinella pseudospiralis]